MAEHEALAGRCADSALVGFRLGVGTVLGQSDQLLAASARAARQHGWAVHTHLAEVREEVVGARLRWGRTSRRGQGVAPGRAGRVAAAGPAGCPAWPGPRADRPAGGAVAAGRAVTRQSRLPVSPVRARRPASVSST
jgi:hypothetical protein